MSYTPVPSVQVNMMETNQAPSPLPSLLHLECGDKQMSGFTVATKGCSTHSHEIAPNAGRAGLNGGGERQETVRPRAPYASKETQIQCATWLLCSLAKVFQRKRFNLFTNPC